MASQQQDQQQVSARAAMSSLQLDPEGMFDLGSDGFLRSFSGPFTRNVIDAIGLSPTQIKELLDQHPEPWKQETEDKFRGVDGRKVVDHEALFSPPEDSRPKIYTKEEFDKMVEEVMEENRLLRERIEKEEREGVNVAEKYACGRAYNNYNLGPKTV